MSHFRPFLPLVASLALPLVPSLAYAQATSPTAAGCGPAVAATESVAVEPVTTPPPPLPVYEQPPMPAPGHLWTTGYWNYGSDGYFWVPGVWVEPPSVGLLWTPGYWGWFNGVYIFNRGYWGEH